MINTKRYVRLKNGYLEASLEVHPKAHFGRDGERTEDEFRLTFEEDAHILIQGGEGSLCHFFLTDADDERRVKDTMLILRKEEVVSLLCLLLSDKRIQEEVLTEEVRDEESRHVLDPEIVKAILPKQ